MRLEDLKESLCEGDCKECDTPKQLLEIIEGLKNRLAEFTVIYDLNVTTLGQVKKSAAKYANCCKPKGTDNNTWSRSPIRSAIVKGFIMGAKTEHAHMKDGV